MNFTESQLKAINEDKKNIIVSAAAGSGKTTVLCRRIVKRIIEGKTDIDRLLVVTFTKASAKDLREKLYKELNKAYKESPSNRMYRQILMLDKAKISTIHGFAFELIKENSAMLGLSSNIRAADDAEIKLIMNDVMNGLIEEKYSADQRFISLTDNIVTDRDGDLSEIFLYVRSCLMNEPRGLDLLADNIELLRSLNRNNFNDSVYGKFIKEKIKSELEYRREVLAEGASKYASPPEGKKNDGTVFEAMICVINEILNIVDLENIKDAVSNVSVPNFRGVSTVCRAERIPDFEYYKEHFSAVTDLLKNSGAKLLCGYDPETVEEDSRKTAEYLETVYSFLNEFEERLSTEKKKQNIIDFTDMERLAHKLLCDKDNNPTSLARKYSGIFDEVYVDEYQDTNRIQDEIFRAVSHNNLFIVGDIKQSIYRFRGACPEIFANYRKNGFGKEEGVRIFLSENFRSDKSIINVSNAVFSSLMVHVADISYLEEDDLKFKKDQQADKILKVSLAFFSNKAEDCFDEVPIKYEENRELGFSREADYVASTVRALINSGTEPRDIAIMSRSVTDEASISLANAFKYYGIPLSYGSGESLFSKPHVLLLLCLINIIDNPKKDIYFTGALRSVIFGYSNDDLLKIRKYFGESFYDSFLLYYNDLDKESDEYIKADNVLKFIKDGRLFMSYSGVDELIRRIIDSTMLIHKCSVNSEAAKEVETDIYRIYSYSVDYSSNSGMGLPSFIEYINSISRSDVSSSVADDTAGKVKYITIHSSKGLQYPICFIYNCNKSFKYSAKKLETKRLTPIDFDKDYGLGVTLPLDRIENKKQGIFRNIIDQKRRIDCNEEEMRLFYVAVTRAQNKLYITGTDNRSKLDESIKRSLDYSEKGIRKNDVYSAHSFMEWLIMLLPCLPIDLYDFRLNPKHSEAELGCFNRSLDSCNDISSERLSLLQIDYNYKTVAALPSKLSVSKLSPDVLDVSSYDQKDISFKKKNESFAVPEFMNSSDGLSKIKATDIGTATHMIMQFCDFEAAVKNGIDCEITRLLNKGFIDKRTAEIADIKGIEAFLAHPLLKRMLTSEKIYREQRFIIKYPASEFTVDKERSKELLNDELLVQGVIDCLFLDTDGSPVIIDYKTDRFSPGSSKEKVKEILKERYFLQLKYYSEAIKAIFGQPPKEVLLYSFAINDTVDLLK